jgi:hypothetical protein
MALKRYISDADTTIANAFKANLQTRGVSGNMGQSDILETFSIYAQASSTSSELERILVKFPVTGTTIGYMSHDREQDSIPASGSVSFYLRLFNAKHSQTTPKDFNLVVSAVSRHWDEGLGLDMENYSDYGAANWLTASLDGSVPTQWTSPGGDYYSDTNSSFTASFDPGFEDMELDITPLVEQWIDSPGNVLGSKPNYGVGVHFTSPEENEELSYYTKKFFARGSQYFFKRPIIEARWDSTKKDNRGNFFLSSSLVPGPDNLMKLYLYNIVKGRLTNIPVVDTGNILVSMYSGSSNNSVPAGSKLPLPFGGGVAASGDVNITGSWAETGVYSASFAYASSSITTIFDVWHSASIQYHTGSGVSVSTFDSQNWNFNQNYVSKITNLFPSYTTSQPVRFRLYARNKNWSPTIYTVSSENMPNSIIEDAYYKVTRPSDNFPVITYGTGSLNYTRLSYDVSGNYFDLDMTMLDTDTVYSIKFAYVINGAYVEQPEDFRFRIE